MPKHHLLAKTSGSLSLLLTECACTVCLLEETPRAEDKKRLMNKEPESRNANCQKKAEQAKSYKPIVFSTLQRSITNKALPDLHGMVKRPLGQTNCLERDADAPFIQ